LGITETNFLSVLCNQKYQREIVHPKGNIEQCIRIDQKDDVSDGIFDCSWYALYPEMHGQDSPSKEDDHTS